MKNVKLSFSNISSIGFTPLMSYVVKYLNDFFDITIIEDFIENTNNFSYVKKKIYIRKSKNSYDFNKQNIFNKLYKYLFVSVYLIKLLFLKKKHIIYSVDFQVVSITLILKKIFRKRNFKVIYHQFELIDKKALGRENLFFFNKLKKNAKYLDFVIVPERNRLRILLKELNFPKNKSLYFPNINAIDKLSTKKHVLFNNLPKNAKFIGHIGSIGSDHYIDNFLNAAKQFNDTNVYFLFVGKQNDYIKSLSKKINANNIIFVDEIPHDELKNIYSFLDLGFILYKGVDENFEYCAPNKLYEYWAYGVPVIAHKLEGLKNEFTDTKAGILINLENPNEISKTVKKYIESDKRKEIIEYYRKNYYLNDFLNKLLLQIQNL